jgi:transcriptional regulator with XRE-family HTH domain
MAIDRTPRPELAARRRALGYSQEALAQALEVSSTAVAGWEQGKRTPHPRYRPPLAELLVVSLVELDRLIGPTPPIELNGHRVPAWLNTYESLVLEAGRLEMVVRTAVPAMLQTSAYATGTERSVPRSTDDQVRERVEVRIARQAVLGREPDPLELVAVLHEAVLHDAAGGPDVLGDQLDHLLAMAERPNVEILVLPADGRAMFCPGEFELLVRQGDTSPFMAVIAIPGGASYHERDVRSFITMFADVRAAALPPDESARRIEAIRETFR